MESIKQLTNDQINIVNYIEKCLENNIICNAIILGSAGTGKSFLINYLEKNLKDKKKNVILSTHQSIAASNINGITLYKLFSFYDKRISAKLFFEKNHCVHFKKKNDSEYIIKKINNAKCYNIKKIFLKKNKNNWLLIDEISNISLELLDEINYILQKSFENNEIFGGINVIFFGDFYQLRPVEDNPIYMIGDKEHFIKTFKLFELKTNLRQKNEDFFKLCEGIKKSTLTSDQKKKLNSRLIKNLSKEEQNEISQITHIFPTKKKCDEFNYFNLKQLNSKIYKFECNDIYYEDNVFLSEKEKTTFQGLNQNVILCENAKVMITSNFVHNNKLYNNGEIVYVSKIQENKNKLLKNDIYIKSDTIEEFIIPEIERTLEKYDNNGNPITIFRRTMCPLQLSWAVTTHKIQGITLKEAVVDLGINNFDPVQLYVNISRVQTFDKLYITDLKLPLNKSKDRKLVKNFINELKMNNK